MSLRIYLRLVLGFMLVDTIVLGLLYSMQGGGGFTAVFLVLRALADLLFVATNAHTLSLKSRDAMMLFWLLGAGMVGAILSVAGPSVYSFLQAVSDVLLPALFIFKVALIIRLLPGLHDLEGEVRLLVRWLLLGSVIQIVIFLTIGRFYGAYAGIAVPVTLPMADALARYAPALGLLSIVLILASGKRAILLSALAAFGALILGARRRFLTAGAMAVVLLIFVAIAPLFEDTTRKFDATLSATEELAEMAERGPGAILDEDIRAGFYLATAGRSEEFYGLISEMRPVNYVVGLGAGFTYGYAHSDGEVTGYSNSHFSPLSLTYKFGILFCIAFYWFVFGTTFRLIRSGVALGRLTGFALLMFGIQSVFSFNLFAESLLPVVSAIGAYLNGERYGPVGSITPEYSRMPPAG